MNFSINPSVQIVFGALLSIMMYIATGAATAPPSLVEPETWGLFVKWNVWLLQWTTPLAMIFPALSSVKPGPLVKKDPP